VTVIDLFAGGARGWCHAARQLGLDPLGIELDDAACRVSQAAGFPTLQADVSALDPLDFAPCTGLVGGAPCPSFSMAGKGIGRAAIPFLTEAIERMAHGEVIDRAELDAACADPTAHLVLEPLRWALALRPRWLAQEQVEPVLPLWEATAAALRLHGYWAWCGVVSSETFGTPQTRRRAILLASLDGPVSAPVATHQRYIAPRRQEEGKGLFALPEPERIVLPEDRDLLPWVSMAQALGWDGGAYRLARGEGMQERHGTRPDTPMSEPAPAISTKVRTATWQLRANANAAVRGVDEPAPTITAGHDSGERVWQPTHYDRRQQSNGEPVPLIDVDRPAPTLGAEGLAKGRDVWVTERPAPTVTGSRRSGDGCLIGRQLPDGEDRSVGGWSDRERSATDDGRHTAVRVSLEEAAILQGFPPSHPWMAAGSKTAAYKCVGNAIPPQMALAALKAAGAAPVPASSTLLRWPKPQHPSEDCAAPPDAATAPAHRSPG
jgi:DNA (cytosine-5)-methyltransferase 1